MAFILKIEVSYDAQYKVFNITEAPDNPWGGENPNRVDISKAYIDVWAADSSGDHFKLQVIDVTEAIKTGTLNVQTSLIEKDGVYLFFLKVEIEEIITSLGELRLVAQTVDEYISKFWAKFAYTGSVERSKGIFKICTELEALRSGLDALCIVNEKAAAVEVLNTMEKIIYLNKKYLK